MTEPRIYVASLSDYNAGILHGTWIDLDGKDADDVWAEINAMLAASPEFRRFPMGGPAEEWAIHDYEGFGKLLGEYESIDKVVAIAEAIAAEADAGSTVAYLEHFNGELDRFDDRYRGKWDSFKDYVIGSELADAYLGLSELRHASRERASLYGFGDVIDRLEAYIDWDAVARDLEPDYTVVATPEYPNGAEVFVFEDNA